MNVFGVQDLIEADKIVAQLQERVGDLLLEAINTDITVNQERD